MSQLDSAKNAVAPDNIYFDVTSTNFQSKNEPPAAFSFTDARTIPFVNNPSLYNLSIIRFTADTLTVPVFIPSIEPNQSDPNLTIYSVSLSYADTGTFPPTIYNYTQVVNWVPQRKNVATPLAPSQTFNKLQNNMTGYYNCYSYTWLVYLITIAYQDCLAGLATLIGLPTTLFPLVNWDSTSNRAILYAPTEFYNLGSATAPNLNAIKIYMNAALYELFGSFPAAYLGFLDDVYYQNYQLLPVWIGGTNGSFLFPNPLAPTIGVSYITLFQESSTTSSISPIVAFVFTSGTLPIETNQVSTPIVLSDNIALPYNTTNNSATQPIITDLVSEDGNYTPNLVYTPPGQYRMITLYGNSPLYNLDFQIYYRLRDGSLQPFKLQSGGSISVKFAFIKK